MVDTLRARRRHMLQEEILTAAETVVREHGLAALVMDDLAARVGISKPTLYSIFPTKDALIEAVSQRALAYVDMALSSGDAQASSLERLVSALRQVIWTRISTGNPVLSPCTPELIQMMQSHTDLHSQQQQIQSQLRLLIEEGQQRREIDPALDPATVIESFYMLLGAFGQPGCTQRESLDPTATADALAAIFQRGVQAGGAASRR